MKSWAEYQKEYSSPATVKRSTPKTFDEFKAVQQARLPKAPAPAIPDLSKQKMVNLQNQVFNQPQLPYNNKVDDFVKGVNPWAAVEDIVGGFANTAIKAAKEREAQRAELKNLIAAAQQNPALRTQYQPKITDLTAQTAPLAYTLLDPLLAKFGDEKSVGPAQETRGTARQNFKADLTPVQSTVADIAFTGADMAAQGGLAAATGLPFIAIAGAQGGSQAAQGALNQGYTAQKAGTLGLLSGITSAATESLGGIGGNVASKALSPLLSKLPSGVASYISKLSGSKLGQILGNALAEGSEEAIEYPAQLVLQNVILDQNAPYDVKQQAYNALIGGVIGGGFGGAKVALQSALKAPQKADPVLPENKPPVVAPSLPDLTKSNTQTAPTPIKPVNQPEHIPALNLSSSVVKPVKLTPPQLPEYNPNLFAKNTVGAAQAADKPTIEQLVNQYGALPKGEPPRIRDIKVPKATEYGKTSLLARTVIESAPEDVAKSTMNMIPDGTLSHVVHTDKDAQVYADSFIKENGMDAALKNWDAVVNGTKQADKNDIALVISTIQKSASEGDSATASKLIVEWAVEETRYGQNIQAVRLLKKATPSGKLYYTQKAVDRLNKELSSRLGSKFSKITIDPESPAVKELLSSTDEATTEKALNNLFKELSDKAPFTWEEKWELWRYRAMLGNPKTVLRNFLGNAIFIPARKIKNLIGSGLEKTIPIPDRTKAILTPKDKPLVQFSKSDFSEVESIVKGITKMDPVSAIKSKRALFKNEFIEKFTSFFPNLADKTDIWFLKGAYTDSLAQAAKARGYTIEFLESGTKQANEALESIRKYAMDEALKSTYRDINAFSKAAIDLKKWMKNYKVGRVLAEGILPFAKTPTNILVRGTEYGPAGFIKSLTYDIAALKSKKITGAQYIDNLSKGLTGTGIFSLGALLVSMGIVSGGSTDDKKQDQFESLQGEQNYSVNVGDYSYTIDWATPVSLPLFVGVETYNAFKTENPLASITTFLDSITKSGEPLFELSMLQGLNEAISTIGSEENKFSGVAKAAVNAGAGYVGQGIPTIIGQTARTIDDTRRAYYTDKNSQFPDFTQYPLQRNMAKLPGVSQTLHPKIDQWGRRDVNTNVAGRIAENFISPGYLEPNKSTPVDKEVNRLYQSTSDAAVLPSYAPKYFTYTQKDNNGNSLGSVRKDLTAEEYTEFAEDKGQNAYAYLLDLVKNSDYKNLPDADKAAIIKNAYEYSTAKAKESVSDYVPDGWLAKARAAEQRGIDIPDYLLYQQYLPSSPTQQETQSSLNQTDFSTSQKAYLWALQNAKWKNNPFK